MTETVEAIFDGHVFRPIGTPSLTANKRYTLIIKHKDDEPETRNAFDVLSDLTGTVEGPEDWAVHHDQYLYGENHPPLHPENDSDK